ncbi:unnamed protein product [Hyaloperonospora brassicae]|uniref:RanBP2-type domain-containing protein n=1 Tax=Hyaloperonospora brassicae TaxID=162125 RepID=A0AAV0SYT6_HYABA|nr:unnamed protein product [Hyaloperonospora brassicae]
MSAAVAAESRVFEHKTVAGGKDIRVACATCTFLNAADATCCGVCGSETKAPTHEVQADGSWHCGSCETVNRRAAKECAHCRLPLYSLVTRAAPAQIFCSRCGFLNDGDNSTCVQCDYTIRTKLDKISSGLSDSTNFLARDMGMNIHVKCPGCHIVCYVPPATACLRCGSCHTYFASPSVGVVTNFHMSRLASSISSSFMGLFGKKRTEQEEDDIARDQVEAREVPVGRLIAVGQSASTSSHDLVHATNDKSEPPTSHRENEVLEDEVGEKRDAAQAEESSDVQDGKPPVCEKSVKVDMKSPEALDTKSREALDTIDCAGDCAGSQKVVAKPKQSLVRSDDLSSGDKPPMLARSLPLRAALLPPRQELVLVEGDIVEL